MGFEPKNKAKSATPKSSGGKTKPSRGSQKTQTIKNKLRARLRHLKKYPNDEQAVTDIAAATRWSEAKP